jgi:CheY-like chemotaxis protein
MSDPSDWRVLIVDDDPDNVGVLELVLEFHNATTRVAASGQECLDILQAEESPTLLLVDIQMPGMTGYELLERIRSNEAWRDLPVVAVTAHAMSGDADRIMRAGFDGYLSKPVDVASLVDDLRSILEASETHD